MKLKQTATIVLYCLVFIVQQGKGQYVVSKIFGGNAEGIPAISTSLNKPYKVKVDANNNLFIADTYNHCVRKVEAATGKIYTIAGNRKPGFSGDGKLAVNARLNYPSGVEVDSDGNVYIADRDNYRIRKVDVATGIITTIAGVGLGGNYGDGDLAVAAQLSNPKDLVLDSNGNLLIATGHKVRKINFSTGIITTIAGSATFGFSGDGGLAVNAQLSDVNGVDVDNNGNVFIADSQNHRIRKVDAATGNISTVAGSANIGLFGDFGNATSAALNYPTGVKVNGTGGFYIADYNNYTMRYVDKNGMITSVAGAGYSGPMGQYFYVTGIDIATSGEIYFTSNNYIYKISQTWDFITVAGNGEAGYALGYSGDGGQATAAQFSKSGRVAIDSDGNIYIADNHRIRKLTVATGVVTVIAGNGQSSSSGDGGLAVNARVGFPKALTLDANNNIYIVDGYRSSVRKIDANTKIITTVAGGGRSVDEGEPATNAKFNQPIQVVVDAAGNLYILNKGDHQVRKVDAVTKTIATVAGNGTRGFSGDGGLAVNAQMHYPTDMAVDTQGNIYICDRHNYRIRKVNTSGMITTIFGNGKSYKSGDGGLAVNASGAPETIMLDAQNNIYLNSRKIDAATGIISSLTSNGGDKGLESSDNSEYLTTDYLTSDNQGNLYTYGYKLIPATEIDVKYGSKSIKNGFSQSFGSIAQHVSKNLSFIIKNKGVKKLNLTNINVTGDFTFTGNYPSSLDVGASATITIAMNVTSIGNKTGSLTIQNNDPDETTYVIQLTGQVYAPVSTPVTTKSQYLMSWIGGTGVDGYSGDNGDAKLAQFDFPSGMATDGSGNIYVAELSNHTVRKINVATGIVTTVAGNGTSGYSGDGGLAVDAKMDNPQHIALDSKDNLYIVDHSNHCVRRVDAKTGIITTIVGKGYQGYSGDGALAKNATLNYPMGLAIDANDHIYISDGWNHCIRKINAQTGIITTIAGTGTLGYSGDGGLATNAQMGYPSGIAVNSKGDIYIADDHHHYIRTVDAGTGVITTIAGTGKMYSSIGDGLAVNASFYKIYSLKLDLNENLMVTDQGSHIYEINQTTGAISIIAGSGSIDQSKATGVATQMPVNRVLGLAVDTKGNMYFSEGNHGQIKKLTPTTDINVRQGTQSLKDGDNYGFEKAALNSVETREFVIENEGMTLLKISSIEVSGDFNLISTSGFQIASGQKQSITIAMNTNSTGIKSGILTITSNDFDESPYNISLSGEVDGLSQTITFSLGTDSTKLVTDTSFTLSGTASSGLAISYTSSDTSVATISGNTVTIMGAGATTITASQAGNDTYAAAVDVVQVLTVDQPTGLARNLANAQLTVYPNPFTETLRIQIKGKVSSAKVQLLILNSQGKVMKSLSKLLSNGYLEVPVVSLPAGQYLVKINIGKETIIRQVVKL